MGKKNANRRRELTGREQPVNLKSLLSEQLTVGMCSLLSFRSSNQNLIYQRDPFSLFPLLSHGYILVHLVKVVFQWLSLERSSALHMRLSLSIILHLTGVTHLYHYVPRKVCLSNSYLMHKHMSNTHFRGLLNVYDLKQYESWRAICKVKINNCIIKWLK